MSGEKRTPGPWILSDDQTCGSDVSFYAETPIHRNPRWIGRVYGPGPLTREWAERDANAAFIVEACNAHETLTAQRDALRGALELIAGKGWSSLCVASAAEEMHDIAVSALAIADGAR